MVASTAFATRRGWSVCPGIPWSVCPGIGGQLAPESGGLVHQNLHWDATPEDQRIKFVSWASKMRMHPDFKDKYADNSDVQNRDIAFKKIFDDVMAKQRKEELELYRLLSKDDAFRVAMQDTMKRMLNV